jgi:DNA-binding MarR family transcriptional regulator
MNNTPPTQRPHDGRASAPHTPPSTGRFAYEGLERAIHEKARLGIMTSLTSNPKGLLFNDLKELCCLTDGNLSRHLAVLHDEGLVEIWKSQPLRRPQTLIRLTDEGRRRFLDYIATLERVVADALATQSTSTSNAATTPSRSEGWSPA